MVEAMKKEIVLRKNELENEKIETIYFGGGTPSLLDYKEIQSILEIIKLEFEVEKNAEITLEANPDDLGIDFLNHLHIIGINRLSIGIQSFFDEDLQLMNRAHNSNQAEKCILDAQKVGFKNISIDLIYGIQHSSNEKWIQNVQKAIDLQVPHVSSYALTIEEKTELHHKIKTNQLPNIDDEKQVEQFHILQKLLTENNYHHYEISNFGKKDFYSKHNTSYWKGKKYLGIGPSAHSFDGDKIRKWNIANNYKYLKKINASENAFSQEILTEKEQYNEYIMIGLRTEFGINSNYIQEKYSSETYSHFTKSIQKHFDSLVFNQGSITIKREFWFLSDGIASDFFII